MRRWTGRTVVAIAVLITVVACGGPMQPTATIVPKTEDIGNGNYLTSVLAGETNDALTEDGSQALAVDLSDAEVAALAATDWTTSLDKLVQAGAVRKLLTSVTPVYDKHYAGMTVSLTLPTGPADDSGVRTMRAAAGEDNVVTLRAAVIAALMDLSHGRPERCALTADEVRALGGDNPPAGPLAVLGECVERYGTEALPPEIAMEVAEACGDGDCTAESTGRAVWTAVGMTVLHDLLTDVADAIPRLMTGLTDTWEVTFLYPNGYTYKAKYTYLSDGTARYEHRNEDEGTPGFGQTGIVSGTWTYYWGFDPPFDPGRLAFRVTIVFDTCVQDRPQPESYLGLTSLCDHWLAPANDQLPPGVRFRDYAPTDDPDVFLTESTNIWHTARRQSR